MQQLLYSRHARQCSLTRSPLPRKASVIPKLTCPSAAVPRDSKCYATPLSGWPFVSIPSLYPVRAKLSSLLYSRLKNTEDARNVPSPAVFVAQAGFRKQRNDMPQRPPSDTMFVAGPEQLAS